MTGEILAYNDPSDPFALLKAALVLVDLPKNASNPCRSVQELCRELGWGIRVTTQASIPRGSGLGTSSILAGAVLRALAGLMGHELTPPELFDRVLSLEQMLTTGGGWQDQVGGLLGGIKLITSEAGLQQKLKVQELSLSAAQWGELNSRLVLVYTGRQRLARNLLRNVMGRWMARDPETVRIQQTIAALALQMREALLKGDLSCCGELLSEHWECNKRMDASCTNSFIDGLFKTMAPFINGGKLAGAGGGGFAFVIAKDAERALALREVLAQKYRGTPLEVWECAIPEVGMIVDQDQEGPAATEVSIPAYQSKLGKSKLGTVTT
jgi:fucokinase